MRRPMTNDECRMTNVYGVVRCARNARRRRERRGRCVRRVVWVLVALAAVLWLSGCERSQVDRALMGAVLGLSTFLLVGLVVMAVTEQGRQDRLGEAYEEPNDECRMTNDECTHVRLGLEDLRGIVNACGLESREAMLCVESALTTTHVDDYVDALRSAHEKLRQVTKTLGDLQRSLITANAEVCPPGGVS